MIGHGIKSEVLNNRFLMLKSKDYDHEGITLALQILDTNGKFLSAKK